MLTSVTATATTSGTVKRDAPHPNPLPATRGEGTLEVEVQQQESVARGLRVVVRDAGRAALAEVEVAVAAGVDPIVVQGVVHLQRQADLAGHGIRGIEIGRE